MSIWHRGGYMVVKAKLVILLHRNSLMGALVRLLVNFELFVCQMNRNLESLTTKWTKCPLGGSALFATFFEKSQNEVFHFL